ncbi:hypothetical protein ACU686_01930 [Yinghuangia aomiensis]
MGDCAAPGTFCRPEEKRNADWTLLNQATSPWARSTRTAHTAAATTTSWRSSSRTAE